MNEELIKLRRFARQFRVWQSEMNNHSFRLLLARLDEAERARLDASRRALHDIDLVAAIRAGIAAICE